MAESSESVKCHYSHFDIALCDLESVYYCAIERSFNGNVYLNQFPPFKVILLDQLFTYCTHSHTPQWTDTWNTMLYKKEFSFFVKAVLYGCQNFQKVKINVYSHLLDVLQSNITRLRGSFFGGLNKIPSSCAHCKHVKEHLRETEQTYRTKEMQFFFFFLRSCL